MDYFRQKFNKEMPVWVREKIPPWKICHFNLRGKIPLSEIVKRWWKIKGMFLDMERKSRRAITDDGWVQL